MTYTLTPIAKTANYSARSYAANATVMGYTNLTNSNCSSSQTSSPYTITSSSQFVGVVVGMCLRVNANIYKITAVASTSSMTGTLISGSNGSWSAQVWFASHPVFANVAVGAAITLSSVAYTVSSKLNDSVITLNTTVATTTTLTFTNYTNRPYTFTTIQSWNVKKTSNPMKITLPTMDSDQTIIFDIDGVERSISISAEVTDTPANLATIVIPTIESINDGQQFTAGKFAISCDMPDRIYYVYAQDVSWEYTTEFSNVLNVSMSLLERGV